MTIYDPKAGRLLSESEEREDARLRHRPPYPLQHLGAVVEITRRSQRIILAALHEALTASVSPARVKWLRRVADDLDRGVSRLETAILSFDVEDAPIVRTEDPPVVMPLQVQVGLQERVYGLAATLSEEYPATGEDAARLGKELAQAGDVQELRKLRDLLIREAEDPVRHGAALDAFLYGAALDAFPYGGLEPSNP